LGDPFGLPLSFGLLPRSNCRVHAALAAVLN
jgi:hypothetical protein